jgi:CspA family cold shock protein
VLLRTFLLRFQACPLLMDLRLSSPFFGGPGIRRAAALVKSGHLSFKGEEIATSTHALNMAPFTDFALQRLSKTPRAVRTSPMATAEKKGNIMAAGQIKSIVRDRGFGFIREAGVEKDIFFHRSSLATGAFDQLAEGQRVDFDREPDPRDPSRTHAVNVQLAGEVS